MECLSSLYSEPKDGRLLYECPICGPSHLVTMKEQRIKKLLIEEEDDA